jgi:hypothetical protein
MAQFKLKWMFATLMSRLQMARWFFVSDPYEMWWKL